MWDRYRVNLRARADTAAAEPSHIKQFFAERQEAAIWGLPLFPSIGIDWLFGLTGLPAVLVLLPAVTLFVTGSFFYVPRVFSEARRTRSNGR
jgi:hypothetical protein